MLVNTYITFAFKIRHGEGVSGCRWNSLRKVLPPSGCVSEETRMARVMALAQKRYVPVNMRMRWRTDESRGYDGTANPHRCKLKRVN